MKAAGRALLAACAALSPTLALAASGPPGLVAIVEQFDHLALGDARAVGPLTLAARHFECHLASGHAAEEQWLTESFAECCAGIFLRTYKNEATFRTLVKHWRTFATFGTDQVPIPLANQAWVANDARTRGFLRYGLLYNKGLALRYALHEELGDETFFTFLKSYQKSFAWKFGSTKTLAGLLQYMTKKDYMPFFDKYYWGIEMPKD